MTLDVAVLNMFFLYFTQIQVIDDDRAARTGQFLTGERGAVPPLVTTDFTVLDQGNASPRFLRSTMYNVPVSGDMLKTAHLPFAVTLTPFARVAEGEVRVVWHIMCSAVRISYNNTLYIYVCSCTMYITVMIITFCECFAWLGRLSKHVKMCVSLLNFTAKCV